MSTVSRNEVGDTVSGATPRPWRVIGAPGFRAARVVGDGAGTVADVRYKNGDNDAALIVEAVNDYDRLRAIEAAAREYAEADDAYGEAAAAVPMTDGEWPEHGAPEWAPAMAANRRRNASYAALRSALVPSPPAKGDEAVSTREPRRHELKTWPAFYALVEEGTKPFEVRRNDRSFEVGDTLVLREFSLTEGYTGRAIERVVTSIVYGTPLMGLDPSFVVMGLSR